MTYDEMVTAIAAMHDGGDAMQMAFSDPELADQVTSDTAAAQTLAVESIRLGFEAALECGEAADHVFEEFCANMSPKLFARMLLAFSKQIVHPMDDSINKHTAVDVAETLGPDWAQSWYRFIVLVTKVA